jgi:hypothetical protein
VERVIAGNVCGRDILKNEGIVRRIELANAVVLAVLVIGACVLFSFRAALGVFLGGVVSIIGYYTLKWQLRRAFQDPERIPGRGKLFAGYYLRFFGIVFVIFSIIYYKWAHPIAFLVGLSVVVTSLVLAGLGEYLVMLQKGE